INQTTFFKHISPFRDLCRKSSTGLPACALRIPWKRGRPVRGREALKEVRAGTMEGHADKMCPSITPVRDTTAALLTQ
ncbi:hypothetical protein fugu_009753, partial [Takifugu bimaculatus]